MSVSVPFLRIEHYRTPTKKGVAINFEGHCYLIVGQTVVAEEPMPLYNQLEFLAVQLAKELARMRVPNDKIILQVPITEYPKVLWPK